MHGQALQTALLLPSCTGVPNSLITPIKSVIDSFKDNWEMNGHGFENLQFAYTGTSVMPLGLTSF